MPQCLPNQCEWTSNLLSSSSFRGHVLDRRASFQFQAGQRAETSGGRVIFKLFDRFHAGDDRGDAGLIQDEAEGCLNGGAPRIVPEKSETQAGPVLLNQCLGRHTMTIVAPFKGGGRLRRILTERRTAREGGAGECPEALFFAVLEKRLFRAIDQTVSDLHHVHRIVLSQRDDVLRARGRNAPEPDLAGGSQATQRHPP